MIEPTILLRRKGYICVYLRKQVNRDAIFAVFTNAKNASIKKIFLDMMIEIFMIMLCQTGNVVSAESQQEHYV